MIRTLHAISLLALLVSVGCASMTERIVNDAMNGFVWEADYVPVDGGDPEQLARLYEHLTTTLHIDVEFMPSDAETLRGAYGISYSAGQHLFIKLRQDLSINGTIEVLAHEAAHLFQPPIMSKSEGDVFAEIVSAHVSRRLGVPHAAKTSALWLQAHKPSLRVALDLQKEIAYVANILTPGLMQITTAGRYNR